MNDLGAGVAVGPWRIVSKLGAGGMGAVYRATDGSREVALKVVLPQLTDTKYADRFQREARAASAVAHENIVSCLGSGSAGGLLWIAFELVPSGSLADRLKEGRIAWRQASRLGAQIARGLAAIHAAGIVHRDLKPANVLIDGAGRAKIADLGLARGGGAATLTKTGELLGTPDYMAPEMADSSKGVPGTADLYMLGGTLHCLLTGEPPFGRGLEPIELITAHMQTVPKGVRSFDASIPRPLESLVLRLLEKEPGRRGAGAASVADELEAIADAAPATGSSMGIVVTSLVVGIALGGVATAFALRAASPPAAAPAPASLTPAPAPGPPKPDPRLAFKDDGKPVWWHELPKDQRPAWIDEKTMSWGKRPGEYVWTRDGSILVYVPKCTFPMGADRTIDPDAFDVEAPVHTVPLSAFFIGKFEVTNAQFRRFVEETHHRTKAEEQEDKAGVLFHATCMGAYWDVNLDQPSRTGLTWRHPQPVALAPEEFERLPVVQVVWDDAVAYADWAKLALPTEAQWECAAACVIKDGKGTTRRYTWGDEPPKSGPAMANVRDAAFAREAAARTEAKDLKMVPWDDGYGMRPAPVGSFEGDTSWCGALDMTGNVREWVRDAVGNDGTFYREPKARELDPVFESQEFNHVVRGGSWADGGRDIRTRARSLSPDDHHANELTGFRIAVAAPR
jgi:formylglycine-generating enzyme required for sulfatase activity